MSRGESLTSKGNPPPEGKPPRPSVGAHGGAPNADRDLTQILEYGKKLEEKGLFPKLSQDSETTDAPMTEFQAEKIEHFVSIDELGPMDHAAPEEAPNSDFANFPSETQSPATEAETDITLDSDPLLSPGPEFSTPPPSDDPFQISSVDETQDQTFQVPEFAPPVELDAPQAPPIEPQTEIQTLQPSEAVVERTVMETPPRPQDAPAPAEYSDEPSTEIEFHTDVVKSRGAKVASPVSMQPSPTFRSVERIEPSDSEDALFTLRIEGHLEPVERSRLEVFLEKEAVGLKASDLLPQFETGQVYLPRLTEFVAVSLVQLLRTSSSRIRIFQHSTLSGEAHAIDPSIRFEASTQDSKTSRQSLPPIHLAAPPSGAKESVSLGILTATALLPLDSINSSATGPSGSEEYPRALLRIQNEIQLRARHLGAEWIESFALSWEALSPNETATLSSQSGKSYPQGAWKLTGSGNARRGRP